jgi:hypothetical protein
LNSSVIYTFYNTLNKCLRMTAQRLVRFAFLNSINDRYYISFFPYSTYLNMSFQYFHANTHTHIHTQIYKHRIILHSRILQHFNLWRRSWPTFLLTSNRNYVTSQIKQIDKLLENMFICLSTTRTAYTRL